MTRLGFCSNAYTRFSAEEAIIRVADLGYRGVELLWDRPHLWPPDSPDLTALANLCIEQGLTVTNLNANTAVGYYAAEVPENVFGPSLSSIDESRRAQRLAHVKSALDAADVLGASCVSITSGAPESDCPPQTGLAILRESLTDVLAHADAVGINLGIEAEPGLLLESTREAAAYVASIGHPRLGLNLDIGHAVVCGESPAEMIERYGSIIWHLHLEDIADGKHFHLVPGDGDVDFAAIADALIAVGYDGWASVEVYPFKRDPDTAARRSREHLANWFDAGQ